MSDVADLIDRDRTCDALRANTTRLTALLRSATDPDAPAIGIWTLGDVANHIAWGIENYTAWLRGRPGSDVDEIRNMPAWNIETVRGLPRADLSELARRIDTATDRFVAAARAMPPSEQVRWYAGTQIPAGVAVCMRLTEAVIHGRDIATGAREKWPIDRDDARTISYGIGYVAPYFVDTTKLEFTGTLEMRIRGGPSLYYVVENGDLRVQTTATTAQWRLSVDPVAWILVATGRQSRWRAALSGRIIGWGRDPRLPFKLLAASIPG